MSRWQPEALPRLQKAALELFLEQGYEGTTVDQIAQRAGLTPRTFFRYFADKKEVLFAGTEQFEVQVLEQVRLSPQADPLRRVCEAFEAVAAVYFDTRPDDVRRRRSIIESSAELQEREGQKMTRIGTQVSRLLVEVGHPQAVAQFAAHLGVLVFRLAFAQWAEAGEGPLTATIRSKREELKSLSSG
jgi:AcrR family transcriptional regulator